jgi:hypothetical protein
MHLKSRHPNGNLKIFIKLLPIAMDCVFAEVSQIQVSPVR